MHPYDLTTYCEIEIFLNLLYMSSSGFKSALCMLSWAPGVRYPYIILSMRKFSTSGSYSCRRSIYFVMRF